MVSTGSTQGMTLRISPASRPRNRAVPRAVGSSASCGKRGVNRHSSGTAEAAERLAMDFNAGALPGAVPPNAANGTDDAAGTVVVAAEEGAGTGLPIRI